MNDWGIKVLQLNGVSTATHDPASATREFEREARALARRREQCKQREQGLREAERRIEAKRREVNRRAAAEEQSRREAREALGRRLLAAGARAPALSQEAPAGRKRAWTPDEDEKLRAVVAVGPVKWASVAQAVGTRNAKQCRERWHFQLDPEIKKGGWTAEEDALIAALPHGDWARAAKALPGRTDMAIKNRYNTLERCRKDGRQPLVRNPRTPAAPRSLLPKTAAPRRRRRPAPAPAPPPPNATQADLLEARFAQLAQAPPPAPREKDRVTADRSLLPKTGRVAGRSDRRWAEEREGDMPEKRPVGISKKENGRWLVRIKGARATPIQLDTVTVGTFATAAQAWAAYQGERNL